MQVSFHLASTTSSTGRRHRNFLRLSRKEAVEEEEEERTGRNNCSRSPAEVLSSKNNPNDSGLFTFAVYY